MAPSHGAETHQGLTPSPARTQPGNVQVLQPQVPQLWHPVCSCQRSRLARDDFSITVCSSKKHHPQSLQTLVWTLEQWRRVHRKHSLHIPKNQYPLGTVHLDSIFKTVFTDYQRQQFSFLMYTLEKSLQKVVKNYYEYTANSTNESNDIFINSLALQRSSRQYLTEDMHCSKRSAKSRAGPSAEFCSPGMCSMPRAGTTATEPLVTAEKHQCPPGTGKHLTKTFKNLMSRYFTWPCRHFIKKPNSTAQKRVGLLLLYHCISKRTLFKRVTEKKTFNSKFYERRIKTR